MILNKEQVELMTEKQCLTHLKQLAKTYPLDQPITEKLWPQVDSIANTVLWLEDHIHYCKLRDTAIENNKVRWGTE